MAKKNVQVNTTAIENADVQVKEEATMAQEKQMLLFTASRGKSTRLTWNVLTETLGDQLQKVKGCAIELPIQVAEAIGEDKFVSYIELETIERCVEQQEAVRGTASTFSDVSRRYSKVTGVTGSREAVALDVFAEVLKNVKAGTLSGEWTRPEEEKEAEDIAANAPVVEVNVEEEPANLTTADDIDFSVDAIEE